MDSYILLFYEKINNENIWALQIDNIESLVGFLAAGTPIMRELNENTKNIF